MMQTPIAIIGMGKSGESAERLLLARGFKRQDVLTFDQKAPAQFKDTETLLHEGKPRTLVVSPGVPLKSPWIQHAIKSGIKVTSEINLACEVLTDEKVIGITGSLGKSTTVSLLGTGLLSFDKNGFVGGNLGTPFCDYAFEVQSGRRKKAQWIILELSSYQLENSSALKLEHAAITYLSPNHMERYESLDEYYFTKWRIIHLTRGKLFLNKHGGDLITFAQKRPELARCVICSKENKELQPHALSHAALLGAHNQDNLALAAEVALACHWPISALQAMKTFTGLDHRLENVGSFNGVRFINDSKATAMDSVLTAAHVAHDTLRDEGRLFILLGGKDKNLPWQELESLGHLANTNFLFFGESRDLSRTQAKLPGEPYVKLDEALDGVFKLVKSGDVVLLSPGGTSFDEFKGFEDRGRFFKDKVRTFYANNNANKK